MCVNIDVVVASILIVSNLEEIELTNEFVVTLASEIDNLELRVVVASKIFSLLLNVDDTVLIDSL